MSKSLGNGIDPLEIIDQFGADALRFMLMTGITPGNDMRFKTDKLESSRNFANKLWNASRFVIMNLQDEEGNFKEMSQDCDDINTPSLKDEDKWMISRVNDAVKSWEKYPLNMFMFMDWYVTQKAAK